MKPLRAVFTEPLRVVFTEPLRAVLTKPLRAVVTEPLRVVTPKSGNGGNPVLDRFQGRLGAWATLGVQGFALERWFDGQTPALAQAIALFSNC